MNYGCLFSGVGCSTLAFAALGWTCAFHAETDPFASAVLAHHWPEVPNLGDVTTVDWQQWRGKVDLMMGSPPCFPAGTRIATKRGFIGIESVTTEDEVLTHTLRWRRVLRVGSHIAPTVLVKGQGHWGLRTTAEHPFYALSKKSRIIRRNGKSVRDGWIEGPSWERADALPGKHWACVAAWPAMDIPDVLTRGREVNVPAMDRPSAWWLVGAYVGDGWPSNRRGEWCLGVGRKKAALVERQLRDSGVSYRSDDQRSSVRFTIHGGAFARWIGAHFGSGARNKRLPLWLMGAPRWIREAVFAGIAATDGTSSGQKWEETRVSSVVSPDFALGFRMLANSLGFGGVLSKTAQTPTTVIEGRTVSQSPWAYSSTASRATRSSFERDGMRWGCVRSCAPTGDCEQVFNLEVEDDNSYTADGIVVHNCQSFSVAGKRGGLGDARGNLSMLWAEVVNATDPIWSITENVPGWLTSRDGAFGAFIGALVGGGGAVEPPRGRWKDAGVVVGPARVAAWRVLDAVRFGVPQRRRRVFVVTGRVGAGADPVAVLFERKGVRGHSAESGAPWEEVAGTFDGGSGQRGWCDDLDRCGAFVTHSLRADGFDASEDGTGRGTPLVVSPTLTAPQDGSRQDKIPIVVANAVTCHQAKGGAPTTDNYVVADPICANEARTTSHAGNNPRPRNVVVAFDPVQATHPENRSRFDSDVCHSLARDNAARATITTARPRRLLPVECERLMGMPDGHTLIPYRGKPAADGPRYRAIGNGIAVPVLRWIAQRIARAA